MLAVRVRRIELPTTGWKPVVLPVNYTRNPWDYTLYYLRIQWNKIFSKASIFLDNFVPNSELPLALTVT